MAVTLRKDFLKVWSRRRSKMVLGIGNEADKICSLLWNILVLAKNSRTHTGGEHEPSLLRVGSPAGKSKMKADSRRQNFHR